ncbi:uncharacterized protein LOC134202821 [Armigeres subalbatus]|uniref:uncharacterized protein LOC134202821 n=1 Tax=Armigeres subalbatus TaxID=124917 RepID=UPI002ED5811D
MKLNVANNLIKRIMQLTTSTSIEEQKHTIFQILRQNNYPSSLINRLINRLNNNHPTRPASMNDPPIININQSSTLPSLYSHQAAPPPSLPPSTPQPTSSQQSAISTISQFQNSHRETEFVTYRSIPNIPILSRSVSEILKRDYASVKIATRNIKTTKTLLKPVKDPVPPLEQHNVIYSIPCSDCEKVYIGMTTNQLKKRLSGHKSNVNKHLQTTPNDTQAKTALIQHMMEYQHTFSLDGTKIVDRTFRPSALPMLEMCHIHNTPNTVNYRTDVDGLNSTYAGILHTTKKLSRTQKVRSNTQNITTAVDINE